MNSDAIPQIDLDQTWRILSQDPQAVLIDVRTTAEWNFVGVPDLSSLPNELRTVEWTMFPTGATNPDFVEQATDGLDPSRPILLVCRSGARSQAAATTLAAHGYPNVHNVAPGFEGDLDEHRHRHGGWKDKLPWVQP